MRSISVATANLHAKKFCLHLWRGRSSRVVELETQKLKVPKVLVTGRATRRQGERDLHMHLRERRTPSHSFFVTLTVTTLLSFFRLHRLPHTIANRRGTCGTRSMPRAHGSMPRHGPGEGGIHHMASTARAWFTSARDQWACIAWFASVLAHHIATERLERRRCRRSWAA